MNSIYRYTNRDWIIFLCQKIGSTSNHKSIKQREIWTNNLLSRSTLHQEGLQLIYIKNNRFFFNKNCHNIDRSKDFHLNDLWYVLNWKRKFFIKATIILLSNKGEIGNRRYLKEVPWYWMQFVWFVILQYLKDKNRSYLVVWSSL